MSRFRSLPPDMAEKWGHLNHLQYKPGANEWSSECPVCGTSGHNPLSGTPDRFTMFPEKKGSSARGWCRQCNHFEWVDSDREPPSPAKIREIKEAREEQEKIEEEKLKHRLDTFMASQLWKFFHDEMTERERWMWTKSGIPEPYQDLWSLGFMKHYPSSNFDSSALTIPHFDVGWKASNMQYRLLQPPNPNDKYRFTQGLPHSLWLPEPDKELKGICILCEGMKKGAVVFIKVVVEPDNQQYRVVSVPSKSPARTLYPLLNEFERVYIVMDPDAYYPSKDGRGRRIDPAVYSMVEGINGPAVNLVTLPTKADDFFVKHGGTSRDFMPFLDQAREVKQASNESSDRPTGITRPSPQILRPIPKPASAKFH